jgi:CRP-like cAMP-binding protein
MTLRATLAESTGNYPRLHWSLDEAAHHALSRFGVVHELTAGEEIFQQGGRPEALYLVLDGVVSIVREGEELARVGANHSFGEMGLLLAKPRSADARAESDARVLELSRADIDRMLEKDPAWAARLYRVLAECLAEYLDLSAKK